MKIRGLIFDINGTMVDIETDEGRDDVYKVVANLLTYQEISIHHADLKEMYFNIMKEQRAAKNERHPEFDAVEVFREIIARCSGDFTKKLPAEKLEWLPLFLAEAYRAASRNRLQLYPGVEDVLERLAPKYRLSIVSDGQSAWAEPELHAVGIHHYFNPIIVSGDFGYRKPDRRLFEKALDGAGLNPEETIFVGNDMYHDIYGAGQIGMKTVFFKSNQGLQEKEGVNPDYIIYNFPELLNAIVFFEER